MFAVFLMAAFGAMADDWPPQNGECGTFCEEPGGGGGGGTCWKCVIDAATAHAICDGTTNVTSWSFPGNPNGRTDCTAYNVPDGTYGPNYCQMGGGYCTGMWTSASSHAAEYERQTAAIERLLFRHFPDAMMAWNPEPDLLKVKAGERTAARLRAYRTKFEELIGRPLRPGAIPTEPQPRSRGIIAAMETAHQTGGAK